MTSRLMNVKIDSFNYRAVIPSEKVQEGEYHIRIFNFLVDQINYAITYELVGTC